MSEYQYYEFRAIDKPLTAAQLKRLRELSTRAAISPTSFVNTYQWGNFKGDPSRLVEQMFDAFLYWANWGTRQFQVRLPDSLASLRQIEPYCVGPFVNVRVHKTALILDFEAEEIYDDYYDGEEEDWMGSLLPLREDLLRGDYRCLYLAWLRSVQEDEVEDNEYEPPRPPGLTDESGPLAAFERFFEIDGDLVDAAGESSAAMPPAPSPEELAELLMGLSVEEKDAFLCATIRGECSALGAQLLRRYHGANPPKDKKAAGPGPQTAGELRAAARARREKREHEFAERKEAERRRKDAEQAAARAAYLDRLAAKEEKTWDTIGELIATKRPNDYDRAVRLLVDLRDLAARDKREADFRFGLRIIREENANKPSLQRRLNEAGFAEAPKPSLPMFED